LGFYLLSLALLAYIALPGVPEHGLFSVPVIPGRGAGAGSIWRAPLEPAELMKIAFVLLLARYLRFRSNYRTLRGLLAPFALAVAPALLILKQPALGMACFCARAVRDAVRGRGAGSSTWRPSRAWR